MIFVKSGFDVVFDRKKPLFGSTEKYHHADAVSSSAGAVQVVINKTEKKIVDKSDDRVETIENTLSATDSFSSDNQTASTETQNRESIEHTSATENVNTNILVAAFNTMSQCVNGLQKSVDTLMTEKLYDNSKPYNLHQWYNSSNTAPPLQNTPDALHHGRTGVRSDDFPNVDIVSTGLQKQIIQGKDINLASLLIPSFESPQSHTILADGMEINVGNKPDPHLNRQLTIQEFIKAFGKFKRVMTSAFPGRRFELDAYEEDIIEISNVYDDFLTIDPPHAEGDRSMALMMMIFKRLNVPIAMHKTVGPVSCLEYLGIILDSENGSLSTAGEV
ncbi:unnamed protein product [Mytilus edulis]|uniref:Uncharacterized protein n=1 Tax=Mytilus edulis TaxID=6550 RepID=A0A8S3QGL0_MYTED|nr:unnamed protein product [Mytilus edulis]